MSGSSLLLAPLLEAWPRDVPIPGRANRTSPWASWPIPQSMNPEMQRDRPSPTEGAPRMRSAFSESNLAKSVMILDVLSCRPSDPACRNFSHSDSPRSSQIHLEHLLINCWQQRETKSLACWSPVLRAWRRLTTCAPERPPTTPASVLSVRDVGHTPCLV